MWVYFTGVAVTLCVLSVIIGFFFEEIASEDAVTAFIGCGVFAAVFWPVLLFLAPFGLLVWGLTYAGKELRKQRDLKRKQAHEENK